MPRIAAARLTLCLAVALACGAAATPAGAAVSLQRVGAFASPVYVTGAPGDYDRVYVVEQRGTIQVVRGGQAQQFLDLSAAVRSPGAPDNGGGEEGMLSMAFPPDFQQSRLFYVYFTDTDGNNRVEELRAPTDDAADPASRRRVVLLPHPTAANHNGGQLQFGPDGLLYLAPGDGGAGMSANAQSLSSLLGKVLRIDPRGAAPDTYAIPPDNPFVGQAARGEIWAYGLRNPFRFSFDRQTGDLVLGDVGENTTEEIDFAPAGQGRGRGLNFGWNPCEGSFVTGSTTQACAQAGTTLPVIDRFHSAGWFAIIGGYVVRDPSLPSLAGRYVYADDGLGQLYSARLALPRAQEDGAVGLPLPGVSSFGEDTAGCVYVAQLGGAVSRLVETDATVPCARPAGGGAEPTSSPGGAVPLRTRVKARQRVLRLGGVVAYVRCGVRCTLSAGGRLIVGRRSIAMRRLTRRLRADRRTRIKVRLTRAGRRALVRRLRHHRGAKVRIGIRARDGAGHRSALVHHTVRVRR
jgi:glucose/arabinose dehydrogenase